jgi:hypothetical protein
MATLQSNPWYRLQDLGAGRQLDQHSTVPFGGVLVKDLPGVKYHVIRGVLDSQVVLDGGLKGARQLHMMSQRDPILVKVFRDKDSTAATLQLQVMSQRDSILLKVLREGPPQDGKSVSFARHILLTA